MQQLHLADAWRTALRLGLIPTVEKTFEAHPNPPLPIGIFLPTQTHAHALKVELSALGVLLNVQFLVPKTLRKLLYKNQAVKMASKADRWLASSFSFSTAKATTYWNQLLETVTEAGKADAFSQLIAQYHEAQSSVLEGLGLAHPLQMDRLAWKEWISGLQNGIQPPYQFQSLFVFGFGPDDNPLLPLCLQAIAQSHEAHVFLTAAQDTALQEAWIHTWETALQQEAQWILEESLPIQPKSYPSETLGKSLSVLWDKILETSQVAPPQRIAITSFCPKTLREAAAFLAERNVPCAAALPSNPRGLPLLRAWSQYQLQENIATLTHFLQTLLNYELLSYSDFKQWTHAFTKAAYTLQTDQLSILLQYLNGSESLSFFEDWPIIPEGTSFMEWNDRILEVMQIFGFIEETAPLSPWDSHAPIPKKEHVLAYLEMKYTPSVAFQEPWAPIWIGPAEALSCVDADACFFLLPKDWAKEAPLDPHLQALEAHNASICLKNPASGGMLFHLPLGYVLQPSERISQKLNLIQGLLKSQPQLHLIGDLSPLANLLPESTSASLKSSTLFQDIPQTPLPETEAEAIRTAYLSRRDPHQPLNPYTFTCPSIAKNGLTLPCSAWEEALEHPPLAFYKHILKINPTKPSVLEGATLQKGNWVHEWIQYEGDGLLAQSERAHESLEKAYPEGNPHALSQALWEESHVHALEIAEKVNATFKGQSRLTEVEIPAQLPIPLGKGTIHMKGRIDAIFTEKPIGSITQLDQAVALLDFKTSPRKTLTIRNMQKGYGLQLLLYGLALKQLGATNVSVGYATPSTPLKMLELEDWSDFEALWESLEPISRGLFGNKSFDSFSGLKPYHPVATTS
jgi:hypothetical protein